LISVASDPALALASSQFPHQKQSRSQYHKTHQGQSHADLFRRRSAHRITLVVAAAAAVVAAAVAVATLGAAADQ
jgi:hypothetical protein